MSETGLDWTASSGEGKKITITLRKKEARASVQKPVCPLAKKKGTLWKKKGSPHGENASTLGEVER